MFLLRNRIPFRSDEYDNFLGGSVVANGGHIYKDFVSQHTPVMYYFCAVLYLLGIRTVLAYRMATYAFMSLLWVIMFLRYKKHFGRLTMALYPILYISLMHEIFLSHTVLSEQLQAQGLVILLLELLKYTRVKNLKLCDLIWISFAVFISFGTAFVSIYPIFIMALTVFAYEIYSLIKSRKSEDFKDELKPTLIKGGMLVGICLLPFIVILGYYLIIGNLENAIFGAYTVNRKFYPKYNGGFGSSILSTFLDTFRHLRATLLSLHIPLYLILVLVCAVFFVAYFIIKKKYFKAFSSAAFLYMAGTRTIAEFHALPFLAIGMFFAAFSIKTLLSFAISFVKSLKSDTGFKKSDGYKCAAVKFSCASVSLLLVFVSVFSFYLPSFVNREFIIRGSDFSRDKHSDSVSTVINKLTEPGDVIYDTTLNLYYIDTDTLPATPSFACPWIYDAYKDKILGELAEKKPFLVYIPKEINIWGYPAFEFAHEVYEYVYANYTEFEPCGIPDLYIINDRYSEALARWSTP